MAIALITFVQASLLITVYAACALSSKISQQEERNHHQL